MIATTGYHHLRSSICWRKKYKNKGRRQEKKSKKAEQCSETPMQENPPLMMHPKKAPNFHPTAARQRQCIRHFVEIVYHGTGKLGEAAAFASSKCISSMRHSRKIKEVRKSVEFPLGSKASGGFSSRGAGIRSGKVVMAILLARVSRHDGHTDWCTIL